MKHHLLLRATLLLATAADTRHFHIGLWIIVPIFILAVITAIPVSIVRDRRKRRQLENEWSRTDRR